MEEKSHVIEVLKRTKTALQKSDSLTLNEISNQTIHNASIFQDNSSVTIAVIVYTLSKIIERKYALQVKNWDVFVNRIASFLSLAIKALEQDNAEKYDKYMEMARKSLLSISINLKPYVEEVLRKASINKASRVYEHGISMGQTTKILGVTPWELSEYAGQTRTPDIKYNITITPEKRIKMALEFFS